MLSSLCFSWLNPDKVELYTHMHTYTHMENSTSGVYFLDFSQGDEAATYLWASPEERASTTGLQKLCNPTLALTSPNTYRSMSPEFQPNWTLLAVSSWKRLLLHWLWDITPALLLAWGPLIPRCPPLNQLTFLLKAWIVPFSGSLNRMVGSRTANKISKNGGSRRCTGSMWQEP